MSEDVSFIVHENSAFNPEGGVPVVPQISWQAAVNESQIIRQDELLKCWRELFIFLEHYIVLASHNVSLLFQAGYDQVSVLVVEVCGAAGFWLVCEGEQIEHQDSHALAVSVFIWVNHFGHNDVVW